MKLKPCPFCGVGLTSLTMVEDGQVTVYCVDCGAQGPFKENRRLAELAWNRRKKARDVESGIVPLPRWRRVS